MGFFDSLFGKEERSQADIDFENRVRNDGAQYAGKRLADIINEKITSKELAIQFILEELDAASQGNGFAKNFVKNSGFEPNQYMGAMKKTKWEGDPSKLEELQLFYRIFLVKIADIDLMVKLSTVIVDNIMKIWKLGKYADTAKQSGNNMSHGEIIFSVAYSPNGVMALSGGGNTLKLWNISTCEVVRTFEGHTKTISSVAFSPDGKTILSGSDDSTLKLWDINTGKEIQTFKGHTKWVRSVAFSPDGKTALSGGSDETLRVWDINTGVEI